MARRAWQTPKLPPLVGAKECAEILGIDKMTLKRWRDEGYFLEPAPNSPAAGPVWAREDVERFAEEQGRRRAPASA